MQPFFHLDELGRLALEQLHYGHAGPGGHDFGDIVGGDLFLEQPVRTRKRRNCGLLLFLARL